MTAGILCATIILMSMPNAEFACKHMDDLVTYSEQYNISSTVLISLIHHESRWKPHVKSHMGACGLTQVLPKYTGSKKTGVPKLTCDNLKDPTTSIKTGAQTLKHWLRSYARGKYKTALCGYSSGYNCKGENKSTRGMLYANRVLKMSRNIKRKAKNVKYECYYDSEFKEVICGCGC